MAKTNPVPRLSVQTQATPSTPGSTQGTVSRRLRGPRKNVNPGLFIANPDNSDEEVHHSGGSPVSLGERGAQRSPVKGSPATISSNGSGGRPMLGSSSSGGSGSIPIIPAGQGSPRSNLPPIPSIPAPQASPLPAVSSSVPSPQPLPPTPGPPQPPPQPERHLARSATTPYPAQQQPRGHSSRPSLGASPFPTSPSRALPPLPMPSPTITPTPQPNVSPAREFPSSAPAAQQAHPPTPSPIQSSVNSFGGQQQRMASPEATLSPATATSDGSRGLMGATELGNRARSGSFQSQRIKLQVTTDNESFTTVDITGMTTAEGIKERVFSKLRFRDDEHLNLSLFRTDVDEQPDSTPVPADALLQLCQTLGDAKATLKFFVMHTVPTASRAAIVPLIADGPRINTDNLHAPVRSPSRHSREGSMSSASEVERGTSSSSWSEIQHDEVDAARRAGARRYGAHGARIGTSTGSSRSPLTPAQNAVDLRYGASTPSPTRLEPPRAPSPLRRSQNTPTPPRNAAAGPSSSPGRVTDDGMDPATKALIESMQKEETEKEERRKRQLEADEELARREQQSERDVWEMMQELEAENETRRRAQIEQDEIRAREVQEEDRRAEDERAAQLAARTAWEAEQREAEQEDENTWMARPSVVASERRAKAAHWQSMSSGRETPFDSHTLPAIGGSSGTRRPSGSDPHYEASRHHHYPANNPLFGQQFVTTPPANSDSRQHGGYNNEQISEYRPTHPGQRQTRREMGPYHESLMSPSLQNARSMDSLRQEAPVSRPPFQAIGSVPPRSAITPGSSSSSMGRASRGRSQDGRYPDSGRPAPLHLHSAPEAQPGYVAFPTPLPRNADTTWSYQEEGSPRQGGYDRIPSPRPHTTFEYGEPQTAALPRRPSTLYDEEGPVARTVQTHTGEYSWRAGSVSAATQRSVTPVGSRRSTEPDLGREGSLLPYTTSPEHSWLSVPRPKRDVSETDTLSIAGTVSSQATTVRPRRGSGDDEEDSANTARADWASQLRRMIERGEGTLRPVAPLEDDEEEATLFISGPSRLETSPSRPNLKVNTADVVVPALVDSSTPSDSATESEGETRVHRAKSFRPPKDEPNQWHVRPEPEALYENLDNYFPKIDLDKPIVDGALSTPTTPASESPRVVTAAPPVHPSRQPLISSPKPDEPKPMPPPVHPARSAFNKAENRKSIRVMADSKRRTLLRSEDKKERINRDLDEKPKRRLSMWGHKIQEVTPSRISNWMNGQFNTTIPESPSQPEVENTETTITPSASSSSVKPTTLNWVKGELIGKGSYGRVYIALNVTTGDMMAVKQVELPVTDEDRHDKKQVSMVDALKSEIALLKDMYHPNIVAYLGCETSIDHLSIFLEYVPGGTIASIYRTPNQARFEEQLVKFFTQQILEGLAYLHRMNIWHRDLKGDNILVDAAGVCKISDFGISKKTNDAYDSFANATTMKGSVFWMAPEMIHAPNDEKSYSGKVDIWSLGCVVLEMWSGRRPWGDYEQVAAMFEMFNHRARPPIPADVQLSPPALDFLNERCLAKDPGDRPVAWELLKHPFITEVDPKWTFANSKIGKAVAKKAPKTVRAPMT